MADPEIITLSSSDDDSKPQVLKRSSKAEKMNKNLTLLQKSAQNTNQSKYLQPLQNKNALVQNQAVAPGSKSIIIELSTEQAKKMLHKKAKFNMQSSAEHSNSTSQQYSKHLPKSLSITTFKIKNESRNLVSSSNPRLIMLRAKPINALSTNTRPQSKTEVDSTKIQNAVSDYNSKISSSLAIRSQLVSNSILKSTNVPNGAKTPVCDNNKMNIPSSVLNCLKKNGISVTNTQVDSRSNSGSQSLLLDSHNSLSNVKNLMKKNGSIGPFPNTTYVKSNSLCPAFRVSKRKLEHTDINDQNKLLCIRKQSAVPSQNLTDIRKKPSIKITLKKNENIKSPPIVADSSHKSLNLAQVQKSSDMSQKYNSNNKSSIKLNSDTNPSAKNSLLPLSSKSALTIALVGSSSKVVHLNANPPKNVLQSSSPSKFHNSLQTYAVPVQKYSKSPPFLNSALSVTVVNSPKTSRPIKNCNKQSISATAGTEKKSQHNELSSSQHKKHSSSITVKSAASVPKNIDVTKDRDTLLTYLALSKKNIEQNSVESQEIVRPTVKSKIIPFVSISRNKCTVSYGEPIKLTDVSKKIKNWPKPVILLERMSLFESYIQKKVSLNEPSKNKLVILGKTSNMKENHFPSLPNVISKNAVSENDTVSVETQNIGKIVNRIAVKTQNPDKISHKDNLGETAVKIQNGDKIPNPDVISEKKDEKESNSEIFEVRKEDSNDLTNINKIIDQTVRFKENCLSELPYSFCIANKDTNSLKDLPEQKCWNFAGASVNDSPKKESERMLSGISVVNKKDNSDNEELCIENLLKDSVSIVEIAEEIIFKLCDEIPCDIVAVTDKTPSLISKKQDNFDRINLKIYEVSVEALNAASSTISLSENTVKNTSFKQGSSSFCVSSKHLIQNINELCENTDFKDLPKNILCNSIEREQNCFPIFEDESFQKKCNIECPLGGEACLHAFQEFSNSSKSGLEKVSHRKLSRDEKQDNILALEKTSNGIHPNITKTDNDDCKNISLDQYSILNCMSDILQKLDQDFENNSTGIKGILVNGTSNNTKLSVSHGYNTDMKHNLPQHDELEMRDGKKSPGGSSAACLKSFYWNEKQDLDLSDKDNYGAYSEDEEKCILSDKQVTSPKLSLKRKQLDRCLLGAVNGHTTLENTKRIKLTQLESAADIQCQKKDLICTDQLTFDKVCQREENRKKFVEFLQYSKTLMDKTSENDKNKIVKKMEQQLYSTQHWYLSSKAFDTLMDLSKEKLEKDNSNIFIVLCEMREEIKKYKLKASFRNCAASSFSLKNGIVGESKKFINANNFSPNTSSQSVWPSDEPSTSKASTSSAIGSNIMTKKTLDFLSSDSLFSNQDVSDLPCVSDGIVSKEDSLSKPQSSILTLDASQNSILNGNVAKREKKNTCETSPSVSSLSTNGEMEKQDLYATASTSVACSSTSGTRERTTIEGNESECESASGRLKPHSLSSLATEKDKKNLCKNSSSTIDISTSTIMGYLDPPASTSASCSSVSNSGKQTAFRMEQSKNEIIAERSSSSISSSRGKVGRFIGEQENERNTVRIKKLEKTLYELDKAIKKLQSKELTLEDLEDEDSIYIKEGKYIKRFNSVYKALCRLKKVPSRTGRIIEKRFKYEGSRYSLFNTAIEDLINKKKSHEKFPDFSEVLNILKLVNTTNDMLLHEKDIIVEAERVFKDIGMELQVRRLRDHEDLFGCYLTDNLNLADDPAEKDDKLKNVLTENNKTFEKSINELINNYAERQRMMGGKDVDDNSEDGNREEVTEDDNREEVTEDDNREEVTEDDNREEVTEDGNREEVTEDGNREEVTEDGNREEATEDDKEEEEEVTEVGEENNVRVMDVEDLPSTTPNSPAQSDKDSPNLSDDDIIEIKDDSDKSTDPTEATVESRLYTSKKEKNYQTIVDVYCEKQKDTSFPFHVDECSIINDAIDIESNSSDDDDLLPLHDLIGR